jgi:hypothetical protein
VAIALKWARFDHGMINDYHSRVVDFFEILTSGGFEPMN